MTTCTPVSVGFERILVPVDFTDISQKAIAYAKSIARCYGSKIVLAHLGKAVSPVTPPEVVWFDQLSAMQPAEQRLEDTAAALRSSGFEANAINLSGGTHDQILGASQREKADLIVLGTHGRTGVARLLFGSDAEALYRHASCPILVVGPAADPAPPDPLPWRPRDVIYASDLNPESVPTAAFAAQLAQEHQAVFTVLHVDDTEKNRDRQAQLNRFKRAFSEFLPGEVEPNYICRTLMLGYGLGSTIADFASVRHSHLIVMGAQSAFAARSHFSRGIAPQVMAKATCPVLVMHRPY